MQDKMTVVMTVVMTVAMTVTECRTLQRRRRSGPTESCHMAPRWLQMACTTKTCLNVLTTVAFVFVCVELFLLHEKTIREVATVSVQPVLCLAICSLLRAGLPVPLNAAAFWVFCGVFSRCSSLIAFYSTIRSDPTPTPMYEEGTAGKRLPLGTKALLCEYMVNATFREVV